MTLSDPRFTARMAGVFYLLDVAFGPGMLALRKVFVASDAARTATNIIRHETLFRWGFTGNLIAIATYIVVIALFYQLFKPINRTISFLAACFGLVGCTVLAVNCLFYFAPLVVLGQTHLVSAAAVEQPQSLALVFLALYGQLFNISIVFFGLYCLVIGYLIFRSTFLPRILGAGMMLAGLGGLTFLSAAFARSLYPYVMLTWLGEAAVVIWLLAFGVNAERWNELKAKEGAT
jgi:hypothetical protein